MTENPCCKPRALVVFILTISLQLAVISDTVAQNQVPSEASQPVANREQLEIVYFNAVKQRISTWWNHATDCIVSPIIRFHLSADGKVSDVVVDKPSGDKQTDAACLNAVMSIPFDPFPTGMRRANGKPLALRVDMRTGELVPSLYSMWHPSRGIPPHKLIKDLHSPLEFDDSQLGGI